MSVLSEARIELNLEKKGKAEKKSTDYSRLTSCTFPTLQEMKIGSKLV